MKRILVFLIFGMFLLSGTVHADLIASYSFTGNANDSSGNGNAGTVEGAILTEDRFGNLDSAYSFDGSNDYISLDGTFIFHESTDATLSFWMKSADNSHRSVFWTGADNSSDLNRFNIYTNSKFGFDYREESGFIHPLTSTSVTTNQWVHLVITRSGNSYSLYKDGSLVNTATDSSPSLPTNTDGWFIGNRANYMFYGVLDDINIYNTALDSASIQQLYTANSPVPEPSTLLLIGIGLICLAASRRKVTQ